LHVLHIDASEALGRSFDAVELLLIRHAEAEPVLEQTETPANPQLSGKGRDQARRLADWYRSDGFSAIVASPMRRAVETAEVLSEACGLPFETHGDLAEYDRTALTYVPAHLRPGDDPDLQHIVDHGTYAPSPDAEQPDAFSRRALNAVEAVVAAHPGSRVAVVCHGGVINAFVGHIIGVPRLLWFYPENASVTRVAAARTGLRTLLSLNETAHLLGRREC
jgi:probable phosphoglycerate mutase